MRSYDFIITNVDNNSYDWSIECENYKDAFVEAVLQNENIIEISLEKVRNKNNIIWDKN